MPDRPIIFSAPMVCALLDGRKTQTRRVLNPQPVGIKAAWPAGKNAWNIVPEGNRCSVGWQPPRFFAGDRLYVREAHAFGPLDLPPVIYRATAEQDGWEVGPQARWRPSIHMPRWASRLTLIVTDVRVQRLQDISRGDAMEEGCPFANMAAGPDPRAWFQDLWNDLHDTGRSQTPWAENPWVVALTFTVQYGNIAQVGGPA